MGGAPTLEEIAAAFPELEVRTLIGLGGMGVVFHARQPRIERPVALKILPPNLARQPGFAERFTREARALARLNHPHIVAVYDFGERAGFYYLMMEYVDGVNLRQAIRAGVTPEQALGLVPHICEALQFAHDRGVLHRDIKPENILLDTAGTVKLADFGIAKLADDAPSATGLTQTGSQLGTAAYMAPEQIEKPGTVDHRADIYSLGVVFYEMLTGELPIGRFAAPSEKAHVTRGVDEVVMRALEKERDRRQQSATEMKTEVEGVSAAPGSGLSEGWQIRCGTCGGTRPLSEIGGVRIGAASVGKRTLVHCSGCGGLREGIVEPLGSSGLAHYPAASPGGNDRIRQVLLNLAILCAVGIPLAFATPFGRVISSTILVMLTAGLGALYFVWPNDRGAPVPAARARENPWIRRVIVLVLFMILAPILAVGTGLIIPALAQREMELGLRPEPPVIFFGLFTVVAAVCIWRFTRGSSEPPPGVVWSAWPRRIFFALLLLLVAPVVLFAGIAVPAYLRLHNQRPVPNAQQAFLEIRPVATVTRARAPFIGEFSQGSIELVAIVPHPSGWQMGWRMDGSPTSEGPFMNEGSKTFPDAGQIAREFVFRTRNLPRGASLPRFHVTDAAATAGGAGGVEAPGASGESLPDHHLLAATLPHNARTADIRAGVASGPWHTLYEGAAPMGSFATSITHEKVQWALTATAPIETKDGKVVVTSTQPDHPAWEFRVCVLKRDGSELTASRVSGFNGQSAWSFSDVSLVAIDEFQFQVRPREWIEFRGIALNPSAPLPARAGADAQTLQDEGIRIAREKKEMVAKRAAAGMATQEEAVAAARDLAIAEARGDERKMAHARLEFAEESLRRLRAQHEAGVVSPADVLEGESRVNGARQDLDKVRADAVPPGAPK
ncbi:MAG TPA: protein kinase [Chthoniobacteraceae bacterium]|jgi:predicted Ser/Thr protein kinase|nr:protein kinase [Chthoniobacteraceae bacterium]